MAKKKKNSKPRDVFVPELIPPTGLYSVVINKHFKSKVVFRSSSIQVGRILVMLHF